MAEDSRIGRAKAVPCDDRVVKPKTRAEAEKLVLRAPRGAHACEIIRKKSKLPPRWRNEPWVKAAKQIVALRFRIDHESDYVKKQRGSTRLYGIWCVANATCHAICIALFFTNVLVARPFAFPGTRTKTSTTSW